MKIYQNCEETYPVLFERLKPELLRLRGEILEALSDPLAKPFALPSEVPNEYANLSDKEREQKQIEFVEKVGFDYAMYGFEPVAVDLERMEPKMRSIFSSGHAMGKHQFKYAKKTDEVIRKWLYLRKNAIIRGRFFDGSISIDELRTYRQCTSVCPITGIELAFTSEDENWEYEDAHWSIDRLCNRVGYTNSNIAIVSKKANDTRGSLTCLDMLERSLGIVKDDRLAPNQWARYFYMTLSHYEQEVLNGDIIRLAFKTIAPFVFPNFSGSKIQSGFFLFLLDFSEYKQGTGANSIPMSYLRDEFVELGLDQNKAKNLAKEVLQVMKVASKNVSVATQSCFVDLVVHPKMKMIVPALANLYYEYIQKFDDSSVRASISAKDYFQQMSNASGGGGGYI